MKIRISARAYDALLAHANGGQLDDSSSTQLPDGAWEIEVSPQAHERLQVFASAGDFTISDVILMLAGGSPS